MAYKKRPKHVVVEASYVKKTPKQYKPYKLYSCNKTNEMRQFLKFIFGIELYMFQRGFLSIVRSLSTVYTAIGICHTGYGDCLLV